MSPARTSAQLNRFAALDLSGRGSLGAWYGALLLTSGVAASLVIFNVRCHRVDDYRGRYRVWLWIAAGLLWGSLDCATGIHHVIGASLASLVGAPQLADICWIGLYLMAFGALGVRLGIEVWHSLGAFATLAMAAVLYLVGGMAELGLMPQGSQLVSSVLITSVSLAAHVALVSAIGLFARHVHLDASGKLPQRVRAKETKKKRKSKAKLSVVARDDDSSASAPAIGTAAEGKAPAKKAPAAAAKETTPAAPKTNPAAPSTGNFSKPGPLSTKFTPSPPMAARQDEEDEEGDDGDYGEGSKLSKADRRRLKKMNRQDQRRAA